MRAFSRSLAFLMLKDVAIRATRRVAHDDNPTRQQAVADDALLAVVLPCVFDLQRDDGAQ